MGRFLGDFPNLVRCFASVKSETFLTAGPFGGEPLIVLLGRSCNTLRHADSIKQIGVELFRSVVQR